MNPLIDELTHQSLYLDRLLERHKIPKLTEAADNLNSPTSIKKIDGVAKNLPTEQAPGLDGFKGEFHQPLKKKLLPILFKILPKIQELGTFPNSFYEISSHLRPKPHKDITKQLEDRAEMTEETVTKTLKKCAKLA